MSLKQDKFTSTSMASDIGGIELPISTSVTSTIFAVFRGWWVKTVVATLYIVVHVWAFVLGMVSSGNQLEKLNELIRELTSSLDNSTIDLFEKIMIVTVFSVFVLDELLDTMRKDYIKTLHDLRSVKKLQGGSGIPVPVVIDDLMTNEDTMTNNDDTMTNDGIITNHDIITNIDTITNHDTIADNDNISTPLETILNEMECISHQKNRENIRKQKNQLKRSLLVRNMRAHVENQLVMKLPSPPRDNDTEVKMTPPADIEKKIEFIFNTLSWKNIEQYCQKVKAVVALEYRPWLARYIVVKRVSNEHNLHSLFDAFVESLKSDVFNSLIVKETVMNITVLLEKDKRLATNDHKLILKNLGSWLGLITIAKDRPIPLDVQRLAINAYQENEETLMFTLPFLKKIMVSCAKSTVFGPRTPWSTNILNSLAILYKKPGLKFILKCEIEQVFKAMEVALYSQCDKTKNGHNQSGHVAESHAN